MSWIKGRIGGDTLESGFGFKFSKIVAWLFLLVSILMLAYTYYRAEVVFQGALHHRYIVYYIMSIIAIAVSLLVLNLNHQARINIVLTIISFVVGIFLIEIVFYFFEKDKHVSSLDILKAASIKQGVEFDSRTKIQVIRDMRSNGKDVFPQVHPSNILEKGHLDGIFPLGGLSNRTTIETNEGEGYMIFQSDRYGFNNLDYEWNFEYSDWLLIGDSFTQGVAMQQGKDIAGQIRKITGESVINLGKSGNGPLIELATLKEYAEIKKPRKVIWIYFEGNDLDYDLKRERFNKLLMNYLDQGFTQNLIQRQEQIDNILVKHIVKSEKDFINTFKLPKTMKTLGELLRLSHIRKNIHFDNNSKDSLELFSRIMKQAKTMISKWGGELYFVYLPDYNRYTSNVVNNDTYKYRKKVLDVISKLSIPVVDTHNDVFLNHTDISSFFPLRVTSNHYNAKGYNEIAKSIVNGVKKHEDQNNK